MYVCYHYVVNKDEYTRISSVDEIGERYRLNHAIVGKLYHPCSLLNFPVTLAYLVGEWRDLEMWVSRSFKVIGNGTIR